MPGIMTTGVKLYTANGEALVTELQLPMIDPLPDVIILGDRGFIRNQLGIYVEAFIYVVPQVRSY